MKEKINKTNAARLLDKAGIRYELIPYEVDENDLAAAHVAEQLGEPIGQVFKTLVLHGDRTGYFVCVIPGDMEVDLKLAAKVSGNKKAELIPMKQLLPVTGRRPVTRSFTSAPVSAGCKSASLPPTLSPTPAAPSAPSPPHRKRARIDMLNLVQQIFSIIFHLSVNHFSNSFFL